MELSAAEQETMRKFGMSEEEAKLFFSTFARVNDEVLDCYERGLYDTDDADDYCALTISKELCIPLNQVSSILDFWAEAVDLVRSTGGTP